MNIFRNKFKTVLSSSILLLFINNQTSFASPDLADQYRKQADKLSENYRYSESITIYDKAIAEENRENNPRLELVSYLLTSAGRNKFLLGQYENALDYYQQALNINTKLGKKDKISDTFNNLGVLYNAWNKYDKAIYYFQQALKIDTKLGKEDYISGDFNNIGGVYDSWGQYDKALEYYKKALKIDRKLSKERNIAVDLSNIGQIYYSWGQYDKALEHYKQALKIDQKLARKEKIPLRLNNIGQVYDAWGQYDKALEYYNQALKIDQKLGKEAEISTDLNNIGQVYDSLGQYDKALEYYKQALKIDQKLGKEGDISIDLSNIGQVYNSWGQYDKALEYYKQALKIDQKLGKEGNISLRLNNIGQVYDSWGKYDKAFEYYTQALKIDQKLGKEADVSTDLNNIGLVYNSWGKYDKALEYYNQSLKIDQKLGKEGDIAIDYNNIGNIYDLWAQYDKALEYYKQALKINQKLGREGDINSTLSNIGGVYEAWGQFDKALEYFKRSLNLSRKLGKEGDIASRLNNIGNIYCSLKQYDKALEYFKQALKIDKKLGREGKIALRLNNIGGVYDELKQYDKAIENYTKSIELKEKIRKTAKGQIRRDYLASQIKTYQYLISIYTKTKNPLKAFNIIEISKAKLLAETLAGSDSIKVPSLNVIQKTFSDNFAMLSYANSNRKNITEIFASDRNIFGKEISNENIITYVKNKYKNEIEIFISQQGQKTPDNEFNFSSLISFYRELLKTPDSENNEKFKDIAKELYKFLIKPMEKEIKGKKNLLIIPDGILGLIPFETLIDENGKYMIENYNISYIHSLSVFQELKKRNYPKDRKPILAFGGAVYDKINYNSEMIQNKTQLAYLQNDASEKIEKRGSLRNVYASLGYSEWGNLPGTMNEVQQIEKIIKSSKIVTGKDVSENYIKLSSESGDLSKYKVIHFATHGLVVPEIPELSAIVLTQTNDEKEDGYLRTGEIAELKIKADFVDLSACETGVGKIYTGEGVVGLTQPFLIAGANGLSVSLWSVADDSTSQFMSEMYELVEKNKISYSDSITKVKRKFISGEFGEEYKNPFYWAPFVYYGK